MKKILFVINTMGRAGAETALLELLRALSTSDVEISLYVLTGQGEMIEQLPDNVKLLNKKYYNCSVFTAEGKRRLLKTSLASLFRRANIIRLFPYLVKNFFVMLGKKQVYVDKLLWRVLSQGADFFEEQYDLAVAYIEGGSSYYVADHVNAKKKVAFFHTNYERAGYTRALDLDCYLKYDKIFPISEDGMENFLKYYPECKDNTEIFNNIINRDRILELSKQNGGFSDEYHGYRILSVGRLVALKEFHQSIRAMKLIKDKGIDAKWYILGEGELREELEALIKELDLCNDFFLLGAKDNPYVYMAQSDIYVHATRYEGRSIAIQEAQVLGCPILVSNVNGNRELVIHGKDGLICELTPEEICENVVWMFEHKDKAKEFGVAASNRHKNENTEINKLLSLI